MALSRPASQNVASNRIPLWLKVACTAFVFVWVPHYWQAYGPTVFLYFCDIALFITIMALWRESPLLASMPAVGILLPQTLWIVDFLTAAAGIHLTGMTAYMFNPSLSLVTRGVSFFHFWLPLPLVWLVWRLGYDRRAFLGWTVLAWGLMLVCFVLMPAPPPPADNPNLPVNINYVYGLSDERPQTWMPPLLYFVLMLVGLPLLIFWPTHWLLRNIFRPAAEPPHRPSFAIETN